MKKIPTLFIKDDKNVLTKEVAPQNKWVYDDGSYATRKYDGTACMIHDMTLYKRYDAKTNKKTGKQKPIPEGAIKCQEKPDTVTGHFPYWVKCDRNNKSDKYHFEAFDKKNVWEDGTYELCGEKINGNKEHMIGHGLIKHGNHLLNLRSFTYEEILLYLLKNKCEGIVIYNKTGEKMCKIRRKDYGLDW